MRTWMMWMVAWVAAAGCAPERLEPEGPGEAEGRRGPKLVGEVVDHYEASPAFVHPGGGEEVVAWSVTLSSDDASYIAPHFDALDLPEGARLVVRSPDGRRVARYTRTGQARPEGEGFWGMHIPGAQAVLEVVSGVDLPEGAVQMSRFARGFPSAAAESSQEAICSGDDSEWAACYESTEPEAYETSRAVARLMINGVGACTGWLVGSEGHLMTNEHCITSASDAANTMFEFMAEGADCTTSCASYGACPGDVVAQGATLVQLDAGLDYALVRLPTNPTSTYGYLQLAPEGGEVGDRIYIPQHPAAWGKKIAMQDGSSDATITSKSEPSCSYGPVPDVGYYADTQGGSSGSPVIRYDDNVVVALHHCAYCPNRGVPIEAVIDDLVSTGSLPADALAGDGGTTPTDPTTTTTTGGTTTTVPYDVLDDGVPATGLDGAQGSWRIYTFEVPEGATSLTAELYGGTGDADLYVRHGAEPTLSAYDCRPYISGNYELCEIASPAAGTWYVAVQAYASYSGASVVASYSEDTAAVVLENGVPVVGLAGAQDAFQWFTLEVPAGATNLVFRTGQGTGDADLYVRFGAAPTLDTYDCRPYLAGNAERCNFLVPQAGTWHVGVRGYSAYSGLVLRARYNP